MHQLSIDGQHAFYNDSCSNDNNDDGYEYYEIRTPLLSTGVADLTFNSDNTSPSPAYCPFTRNATSAPQGTGTSGVTAGIRAVINSAGDLARLEFLIDVEERLQQLIPRFIPETRRAMSSDPAVLNSKDIANEQGAVAEAAGVGT